MARIPTEEEISLELIHVSVRIATGQLKIMFRSSVVEHLTFNEGCVGSNPTGTTIWESSSVAECVPVKHNVECSIHSSPAKKDR